MTPPDPEALEGRGAGWYTQHVRSNFFRRLSPGLLVLLAACVSPSEWLMEAAVNGRTKEVPGLLARGADPNFREPYYDNATPLMEAAFKGNTEIVQLLLDHGADVNLQKPSGETALVDAVTKGSADIVKMLLDHNADVNARDPNGNTPLIVAAYYGNADVVKILIERGANVNARSAAGVTALSNAQARGNLDIADLLLAAAAKPASRIAAPPAAVPVPKSAAVHSDVDAPLFHSTEHPDDFALVVGIEKYLNELPSAQFAERDAQAVRAHLIGLGYPERNIKFLTGGRATKGSIAAVVEDWLPRNVKPDSRVFVYFSGHGAPDPKSSQAYLVPFDGDPSYLDKTAYPVKTLYASLDALKAKRVIVALDSCFSGAGGRSVLAEGARPLVNKVDASVAAGGKIVLFAAASASEITGSLKEQGHGLFTYYFLKGLGGAAKDSSGAITPRGLFDYLKPKVQDSASRENREQTPQLEGAVDGEIARFE